jgi:hypothetical protein
METSLFDEDKEKQQMSMQDIAGQLRDLQEVSGITVNGISILTVGSDTSWTVEINIASVTPIDGTLITVTTPYGSRSVTVFHYTAPSGTPILASVMANGDGTERTTQLTLTFDGTVTGLTAGNVMISGITVNGVPALTESGTSYTLTISIASITPSAGTLITVTTPYGSRSVTVFNYTVPSGTPILTGVTAMDGSASTPTTYLTLTFDGAVTELTAGNVMISGITVSGVPVLTGSGTSYTLTISIASVTPSAGTLITVTTPYGSRSVTVFNYTAPSVTPILIDVMAVDGSASTPTTQLTLDFSGAVTGLTAGNVMITGITISGTPTLGGGGANWTVAITITSVTPIGGTLITVTTPYGARSVTVFNYTTPSATPILIDVTDNGSASTPTTQLTLTFDGAVTGLHGRERHDKRDHGKRRTGAEWKRDKLDCCDNHNERHTDRRDADYRNHTLWSQKRYGL